MWEVFEESPQAPHVVQPCLKKKGVEEGDCRDKGKNKQTNKKKIVALG